MRLDQRRSAAGASAARSRSNSLRSGMRSDCENRTRPSHAPPLIGSENRAAAAGMSRRPSAKASFSVDQTFERERQRGKRRKARLERAAERSGEFFDRAPSRSPCAAAALRLGSSSGSGETLSPKIEATIRSSIRSSSAMSSRAPGSALAKIAAVSPAQSPIAWKSVVARTPRSFRPPDRRERAARSLLGLGDELVERGREPGMRSTAKPECSSIAPLSFARAAVVIPGLVGRAHAASLITSSPARRRPRSSRSRPRRSSAAPWTGSSCGRTRPRPAASRRS